MLLPVNEGSKHWIGGHRGEDAIDGVLDSDSAVRGSIMNVRVNEMEEKGSNCSSRKSAGAGGNSSH